MPTQTANKEKSYKQELYTKALSTARRDLSNAKIQQYLNGLLFKMKYTYI